LRHGGSDLVNDESRKSPGHPYNFTNRWHRKQRGWI